ncbi:MAG: AmmeMemoRadiSam system protein B [Pseudomonadota bacterium]|nr:AmmeMemoRadiSam system protein B [Pseudomonadota bacterium]
METIRPAAVSGVFYPSNPVELRATIARLLGEADAGDTEPAAIIAPHAGYLYSGPIAASAFAPLKNLSTPPRRIALIGPAHHYPVRGIAAPRATAFSTPLGPLPVDQTTIAALRRRCGVVYSDLAHEREHCLEVELPFLQVLFDTFAIVPLLVGQASPEHVQGVIEALWQRPDTLVVISSDLSHYHDYRTAKKLDRLTCQAIENLAPETIAEHQACGQRPVAGLLLAARGRKLSVSTADLRNSGDTAGGRDRVVGYGAWQLA